MKLRSCLPAVAAISVCLLTCGALDARAAITVSDGDFESPVVPGGTQTLYAQSQSIGSWQVTQGLVTLYGNNANLGPAFAGSQSLLLQGAVTIGVINVAIDGTVAQTVGGLTPGQTYRVDFAYGKATSSSGAVQLNVYVNNQVNAASVFTTTQQWAPGSFEFLAPGNSVTLSFGSNTTIGNAAAIDGPMTLTAVPEPYQYGLVGMVGMLAWAVRQLVSHRKTA
jgi:hypothetical protein